MVNIRLLNIIYSRYMNLKKEKYSSFHTIQIE
nr:MAG TPA: hypothetical protein [Caudoviricetes sp.]DAY68827.1 MAG TPA: hypothetical protein [Caudoviricetes sp.]